jgi:DNA polymerase III sliding clamp (beta) subunit (PCNA family)
MAKIIISNPGLLRAISLCVAPHTDPRPILQGVYFNPVIGRAVATDGHRLMVGTVADPADDVKPFIWKPASKIPLPTKSRVVVLDTETCILDMGKHLIKGEMVEGEYPDWTRVLPSKVTGNGELKLGVNPTLLTDVQKALGASGFAMRWEDSQSPRIDCTPIDQTVTLPPDFRFVVMGMSIRD